jgi:hypothetical protein
MHKSATKCNETLGKWCKNKHGASKIMDTLETYQFPARFFQRNWGTLKEEVIPAVQEFFRNGIMPAGVNDATIVLILKVDQPKKVTDLRPLSLLTSFTKSWQSVWSIE